MILDEEAEDDVCYVCTFLGYVAAQTNNYVSDIVHQLSEQEIARQLKFAHINHCLTFEHAASIFLRRNPIEFGNRRYNDSQQPTFLDMGEIYTVLVTRYLARYKDASVEKAIRVILQSDLSNCLNDFSI
ncbi:hypothetical protein IJT93_03950 [bacterium]|nr:hypothetical protein [bacterium]